jgi:hypothetical protein
LLKRKGLVDGGGNGLISLGKSAAKRKDKELTTLGHQKVGNHD